MLRGHEIYFDGSEWRYSDNGELTATTWKFRACGYCNLPNRADEHDACLGELPNVFNACCGHGASSEAYIQFTDGVTLRGKEAQQEFDNIKRRCQR